MNIKLIVCDIDGTIVAPKEESITPLVKKGFIEAKEKGIKILIATGRHYKFIHKSLFQDLTPDYIVTINGACLVDGKGNTIKKIEIPEESLLRLTAACKERGIGLGFKFEDAIVSYANHTTFVEGYVPDSPLAKSIVDASSSNDYHKTHGLPLGIFLIGEDASILPLKEEFPEFSFAWSFKRGYDVFLTSITKATTIKDVVAMQGIKMENVIAFGDAENDIQMLKEAGIGVAMGNAREIVKENADYVTDSVYEDGVYTALKHFHII